MQTSLTKTLSVAEAKARFSSCIREAEAGQSVIITRHGKEVAAVVGADEARQLERLRAAGPAGGLASLAGGWKGSDELAHHLQQGARTGPRKAPAAN